MTIRPASAVALEAQPVVIGALLLFASDKRKYLKVGVADVRQHWQAEHCDATRISALKLCGGPTTLIALGSQSYLSG